MLYAILAYHVEAEVMSWTPEEDAALMTNLLAGSMTGSTQQKLLGPSARLGGTAKARTLRGPGAGTGAGRAVCRNQGAVAGVLCRGLRQRGRRDRRRARAATGQSVGGLRDPRDRALYPRGEFATAAEG